MLQSIQGNNQFKSVEIPGTEVRRPLGLLDYFVEYSSERNSTCVRLFMPSILVNVDTSDFLMFRDLLFGKERIYS